MEAYHYTATHSCLKGLRESPLCYYPLLFYCYSKNLKWWHLPWIGLFSSSEMLDASDTSTHGNFSIPLRAAEEFFFHWYQQFSFFFFLEPVKMPYLLTFVASAFSLLACCHQLSYPWQVNELQTGKGILRISQSNRIHSCPLKPNSGTWIAFNQ